MSDYEKPALSDLVRTIADYPKPGIQFRDITTLIADPVGLRTAVDGLLWPYLREPVDIVVGIGLTPFSTSSSTLSPTS